MFGIGIVYIGKTIDMKKIALIAILLLILGLAFSTQTVIEKEIVTPVEDTLVEDELVVEDWMTRPFNFNS